MVQTLIARRNLIRIVRRTKIQIQTERLSSRLGFLQKFYRQIRPCLDLAQNTIVVFTSDHDAPFSPIEVAPTLLGLAGIRPQPQMQGFDYSSYLRGQST